MIRYDPSRTSLEDVRAVLQEVGTDLVETREDRLVEEIKVAVIELIHHMNNVDSIVRKSEYLVGKTGLSYAYLSRIFSAHERITLEKFIILHKIERIKDPALIPLMDKIKAVGNEEFERLFPEKQPSRVTIKLKDGRSFSERVDVPKGDYRDPMTMDEIKVKFDALAAPLFGENHCDKIRQAVLNLDRMDTVDGLVRLLVRK